MERVSLDFVGRMWSWMQERWAADFAVAPGVDVFLPSYVSMAGEPYESYSNWDGGQGGKEGMNTIDKRVGRKCIEDGWQRGKGI